MGKSGESTRPRVLFWLAGFVVVFGGLTLIVTKVTGLHPAPPAHPPPATFAPAPAPTPTPPVCASNGLGLTGAINTCVTKGGTQKKKKNPIRADWGGVARARG